MSVGNFPEMFEPRSLSVENFSREICVIQTGRRVTRKLQSLDIRTHIHIHIHTHMHIHIHIHIHIHTHIHVIHINIHIHVYVYIYIYIHINTNTYQKPGRRSRRSGEVAARPFAPPPILTLPIEALPLNLNYLSLIAECWTLFCCFVCFPRASPSQIPRASPRKQTNEISARLLLLLLLRLPRPRPRRRQRRRLRRL